MRDALRTADSDRLTFCEFFSGAGMARLALGDGWRCTFANDHDPAKATAYIANHGAAGFRLADVADLRARDLPGRPALVWASPPCVDISLAGRRGGLNAERSGAFWPFVNLMRELVADGCAPRVVCIENVTALLTSNGGADFAAIVEAFAALGYMVGAVEIDAALFLPQSRRRLFIICARASDVTIAATTQFRPSGLFHTSAILKAHARLPLVLGASWAWWRLPVPPLRNVELCDVLEPVRGDARDLRDILAIMAPSHRAKLEAATAARRHGQTIVGAICRRMRDRRQVAEIRLDGLAQALRCAKGGSSIQTLLIADDVGMHARKITPREAARLMGLPESYRLPEGVTAAHDLVGDGVAVPVVRFLAAHLSAPLAGAWRRAA